MNTHYDIAIIGTGPAGLSAAINAKVRNKKFILFGNDHLSMKLEKAHQINNYLGFPGITGQQMQTLFQEHLKEMEIEITEKKVTNIYHMGDYFSILANNEIFESKTIILATGVQVGKRFEGEDTFLGRGVSYCATCDGNFYRGKVVTVIAYDKKEEEEANFLADIANKVYYIPMYREEVEVDKKIEVIRDRPVEIIGVQQVTKLIMQNRELDTDGIFILRDTISPSTLLPGLETNENHVKVDRLMQTSLPGCFAAGDIVGKPYQYIKAAGEGNIAALSAASYVDAKAKA
ncbi:thioredoxin reductase [Sporanaerobium hydrogeniformans]|uniref:Thioredoxin reductase n=1 Tax=Sporanaerobium hydrogeniformans TaxID=3072179 RepID=A0AC61DFD5_9FIRM|nr:NAD(P)/FAD-dependent oxidoreductase [Sporanaerobium hydrogeniformans]PHV71970.1 thioredoxin reductase [Sporanaerobium hydrogeniformans]